MKFTLSWLKDHLDTSPSLAEIVDALTRVGLEVESVEDPARKYDGFVVASVIEAKQQRRSQRRHTHHVRSPLSGASPNFRPSHKRPIRFLSLTVRIIPKFRTERI